MWTPIIQLTRQLKTRWHKLNEEPDAGYTSETVLTTALLVIGALLAIGIIAAKVQSAANNIDLGTNLGADRGVGVGYVMLSVAR
ncbi:hypothetical protein [Actinophytocola sediminis]